MERCKLDRNVVESLKIEGVNVQLVIWVSLIMCSTVELSTYHI